MITDAQTKAVLEMLQYTARQVVEIHKEVIKLKKNLARRGRIPKATVINLIADKMDLKRQLEELKKFK